MSTSRRFPRIVSAALLAVVMVTSKGPLHSQAPESATTQVTAPVIEPPGIYEEFNLGGYRNLSLIMTDPPNARQSATPAAPPAALPDGGRPLQAVLGATIANRVAVIVEKKRYNGVRIYGVLVGSAADQAGLQKEDIILAIDGVPIISRLQLISEVHRHKPGDKITIKYFRDPVDQIQAVTVTLDGIFADMGPLQTTSIDHRARSTHAQHRSDPGRLSIEIAHDPIAATTQRGIVMGTQRWI